MIDRLQVIDFQCDCYVCLLFLQVSSSLTFRKHYSHLQVAGGQSDDGGFVQLGGDGGGQRQQFGQFVKFTVFLLPSGPGSILGLLLHVVVLLCHTRFSTVTHSLSRWLIAW